MSSSDGHSTVYLAHAVSSAGLPRLALFEFDTGWLWQGGDTLPQQLSIAVIDRAQQLEFKGGAQLPRELMRMFVLAPFDDRDQSAGVLRDWQQAGEAWRGSIVRLDLRSTRANAVPWNVIVYARVPTLHALLSDYLDLILPLLLLGIVVAVAGSRYLYLGWQPVLGRLEEALLALRLGQYRRIDAHSARDAARSLADAYNETAASLEQRWEAQQRLAEIDRLLLEALDLEQSLEPILRRVCSRPERRWQPWR